MLLPPRPAAAAALRLLHLTQPCFALQSLRMTALNCTAHIRMQHPEGGFGGGPYQLAHLAPTYAAVSALVTLGGTEALSGTGCHLAAVCAAFPSISTAARTLCRRPHVRMQAATADPACCCRTCFPPAVVDRPKLHAFLLRMCVPPEQGGGMTMHEGGWVAGWMDGRTKVLLWAVPQAPAEQQPSLPASPSAAPCSPAVPTRRRRGGCAGLLLRPGGL